MKKDSIKGILMKINKDDTKSLHTPIGEMMVASGMLVADVDMLGEEFGIDMGNSIIESADTLKKLRPDWKMNQHSMT